MMSRRRLATFCTILGSLTMLGLAGCNAGGDAQSRVAVVGESRPAEFRSGPTTLGAGDALGRGMHEVILARTAAGATYATVTESADPR